MQSPLPDAAQVQRWILWMRLCVGLNVLVLAINGVLAYALFAIVLAEPVEVAGVTDVSPGVQDEPGDYRIELRSFIVRMTDLLDRAARRNGVNPADVVPTQTEIDSAVETRTIHSDESQRVMQRLKEGFDLFDLTWPIAIPER